MEDFTAPNKAPTAAFLLWTYEFHSSCQLATRFPIERISAYACIHGWAKILCNCIMTITIWYTDTRYQQNKCTRDTTCPSYLKILGYIGQFLIIAWVLWLLQICSCLPANFSPTFIAFSCVTDNKRDIEMTTDAIHYTRLSVPIIVFSARNYEQSRSSLVYPSLELLSHH